MNGRGAYSKFKFESGVHRVERVPETETQGRVHTSTVKVAVLPEAKEDEVQLNQSDIQIDTFRSSGAGGQHVNKQNQLFDLLTFHRVWLLNVRMREVSLKIKRRL